MATCCLSRRRSRASTSPARAPTISAISAAAGRSTGRERPATSPLAGPRFWPPFAPLSAKGPKSPRHRTARARAAGAAVAIAVIGETPYAEMRGDRADLSLSAADLQTMANLKTAGIPVVTVVVSGRPVILDGVLDRTNALLAAWLPGTEASGVADVLFGEYK